MSNKSIDVIDLNDNDLFEEIPIEESEPEVSHKENLRYLLLDTTPDVDINYIESYQCDAWANAYAKMVQMILDVSADTLESNLVNNTASISTYSAVTFDNNGVRHVYHILGI